MLSFDVAAVKYMSHFNLKLFSSVQFYARVKVPEERLISTSGHWDMEALPAWPRILCY